MATKPADKPAAAPTAMAIPQSFIQQLATPIVTGGSSVRSPYVVFPSKIAKAWPKYKAAIPDLKEFEPTLVMPEGAITRVSPLKISVFNGYQFWAQTNAGGDITKVTFEEQRGKEWKEHIDVNVFLYLPTEVRLARIGVATTKCPGFRDAIKQLDIANDDVEWAKLGVGHAQTIKLNLPPNMRFFSIISLGTPRSSKTSGNLYVPTEAEHFPTGSSEWELLGKYLANKEVLDVDMLNINDDTQYRLDFLKSKQ